MVFVGIGIGTMHDDEWTMNDDGSWIEIAFTAKGRVVCLAQANGLGFGHTQFTTQAVGLG